MTVTPAVEEIVPTGSEEVVYENPFLTVTNTPVRFPDGADGHYARVTPGEGFGGVTIPRYVWRGRVYYGLIAQYRFPIKQATLEFPRGGTSNLGKPEAIREMFEEMGVDVSERHALLLGKIFPDTGLLSTEVSVWVVTTTVPSSHSFVEAETGAKNVWVSDGALRGLIDSGRIKCAMTIAAWGILVASGRDNLPVN